MKKRVLSIILAICLLFAAIPLEALAVPYQTALSAGADVSRYFYSQLPSRSRVFYEALEDMLEDGRLKTGTESIELTDEIGQAALAGQIDGSVDLLSEYGAGRDAFYMDHPSVFYVDFSAITIRITSDAKGYHLYMGPGRYPTYYAEGFTSAEQVNAAIEKYNAALDNLVNQAAGLSTDADKVTAIHDYIAKTTTYRSEVTLYEMYNSGIKKAADSVGMIRTAYGCLVNHEGVCESYTRAFKAAMDRLGIPCVMIYGVYKHSDNVPEQHIWNAVEIDGQWYGVDVTMDDPINKKTQYSSTGEDGYENHEYLLVGEGKMAMQHFPAGIMSEANFEFSYPIMNDENQSTKLISDPNSPLQVRYEVRSFEGEASSGTYLVSYMGMNDVEMRKEGYYLVMTNKIYDNVEGWITTDWYYVTSELYSAVTHETIDGKNWTVFPMPHVEFVEFGVTDIPMSGTTADTSDVTALDFYFHGDPNLLLADSGMMHNENGTYRSAPYAIKVRPLQNIRMDINGQSHHVVAQFDDILVLPEVYENYCKDEKIDDPDYMNQLGRATVDDVKLKVLVTDYGVGLESGTRSQDYNYLTKNLTMYHTFPEGGKPYTTIEFDFKPSEMWADDNVLYSFYLEGVVGAWSGKAPNSFGYGCAHPCAICCYRRVGFDYNCFGKPQILSDSDLSLGELDDVIANAQGTPFEEKLKSRLMLVVEDANQKENHLMEEMAEETLKDNVLSASSYNINLTLCAKQLAELKDGMSIRLTCGFPVGYGPEDAGVTFKAYHYIKDSAGNITGIEEIPCTVTPYGLLIEVKSFSPFMIAAVEAKAEDVSADKTVVIVSDVGGKVTVNGETASVITLTEGSQPMSISVTPDEGYNVDTVSVSGTSKDTYTGNDATVFTISYDDIDESGSAIVSAKFVDQKIADEQPGEPVVAKAVAPEDFIISSYGSQSVSVTEGDDIVLSVANPNSAYTYRWYKERAVRGIDNASMIGTGSTVTISPAQLSDSGTYYCKAIAIAESSTAETVSSRTVNVTVRAASSEEEHIHSFTGYVSDGEAGHHAKCSGCDEVKPIEAHVFDSKGVCELCYYIDETKHTHSFDRTDMMASDENGHARVCTFIYKDGKGCDVREPVQPHSFDTEGKCTVCGYVDDSKHQHSVETGWHSDESGHYHVCLHINKDGTHCTYIEGSGEHEYDENHTCTVCGYTMLKEHDYDGVFVPDGALGHYQTCVTCGSRSALSDHTYDDDGVCTVCGYSNFDMHKHRHSDDAKAVDVDEQGHYYICEFPGCSEKFDYSEHDYDSQTLTCKVCGYFNFNLHEHVFHAEADGKEFWKDNGKGEHYTVCTFTLNGISCSQQSENYAHVNDEQGVCKVCGAFTSTHNHADYLEYYPNGDEGHYGVCEFDYGSGIGVCGEKTEVTPHVYGGDDICDVCGYEKKTTPAPAPTPDPDPEPTPTPSPSGGTGRPSNKYVPKQPASITVDDVSASDSIYGEVSDVASDILGVYYVSIDGTGFKAGDLVRVRVHAPGATINSKVLIRDGWEELKNCSMTVDGEYVEFTVDAALIDGYHYFAVVNDFSGYEEIDVPQQAHRVYETAENVR